MIGAAIALGQVNGLTALQRAGVPSLDLDLRREVLDSRVTFARATTATFVDSTGLIASAATNAPRMDYDLVTLACKGLLIEEARTNLITYSEQFDGAAWGKSTGGTGIAPVVTSNAAVAPDGAMTADRIVFNKGAGTTATDQSVVSNASAATVTGQPASASIWLKSATANSYLMRLNFNGQESEGASFPSLITITPAWRRFEVRIASPIDTARTLVLRLRGTQGTDNFADIYAWGAQQENAAFATSYIPTVASQVTRAADVASVTGTNFSSWYRQDEGTFIVWFSYGSDILGGDILLSSDNTSNNSMGFVGTNSGGTGPYFQVLAGGVAQAALLDGSAIAGAFYRVAAAYKVNDFAYTRDGRAVVADASGTLPASTVLHIGCGPGGGNPNNGHIASVCYYPTRLPDATLRALSI